MVLTSAKKPINIVTSYHVISLFFHLILIFSLYCQLFLLISGYYTTCNIKITYQCKIIIIPEEGHIENLGILPLLKKRLTRIVVADGGLKTDDSDWGKDLLHAFSLAREKLHCSFIGLDGRDVTEDIKEKFVNTADGFKPRSYR